MEWIGLVRAALVLSPWMGFYALVRKGSCFSETERRLIGVDVMIQSLWHWMQEFPQDKMPWLECLAFFSTLVLMCVLCTNPRYVYAIHRPLAGLAVMFLCLMLWIDDPIWREIFRIPNTLAFYAQLLFTKPRSQAAAPATTITTQRRVIRVRRIQI